jgi:drug/metabolite transporter superfamily protein YnfA
MADAGDPGLFAEMIAFLKANKAWWMVPILIVLALFGVIAALASSSVAPFIYTLF